MQNTETSREIKKVVGCIQHVCKVESSWRPRWEQLRHEGLEASLIDYRGDDVTVLEPGDLDIYVSDSDSYSDSYSDSSR